MHLNRTDWLFLLSSTIVLLIVIVVIGMWRFTTNKQLEQKKQKETQLSSVIANLNSRTPSPNEIVKSSGDMLNLPFTNCYFPYVDNPEYWVNFPKEVDVSSPIVQYTKAFPTIETCVHKNIVFDLRTTASTINKGLNKRSDEIIKLFLESQFPGIEVVQDQIFKNLWTEWKNEWKWYLSVYAVYKNVNTQQFNTFVGTFDVDELGRLKRSTTFSIDLNSVSAVVFNQMVHKESIRLTSSDQKIIQMFFISARSTGTNQLQIYAKPKFQGLLTSLDLTSTSSTFKNLIILQKDEPMLSLNSNGYGKNTFFFNVSGTGKVIIEQLYTVYLPTELNGVTTWKLDYKTKLYKILTFEPLVLLTNFLEESYRTNIRSGILENLINSSYYNENHSVFKGVFNTVVRQINGGQLSGAYLCTRWDDRDMLYNKFGYENWYRTSYKTLPQSVIFVNNAEQKTYKYYTQVILGFAFDTVTLWDTGNMIDVQNAKFIFRRA